MSSFFFLFVRKTRFWKFCWSAFLAIDGRLLFLCNKIHSRSVSIPLAVYRNSMQKSLNGILPLLPLLFYELCTTKCSLFFNLHTMKIVSFECKQDYFCTFCCQLDFLFILYHAAMRKKWQPRESHATQWDYKHNKSPCFTGLSPVILFFGTLFCHLYTFLNKIRE